MIIYKCSEKNLLHCLVSINMCKNYDGSTESASERVSVTIHLSLVHIFIQQLLEVIKNMAVVKTDTHPHNF